MKTKSEIIAALAALPDLPVMCKVDQDICAHDEYAWMRGQITKIEVEEIYLNNAEDEYWNRDRMFDEIYDSPETYGLSVAPTDEEINKYIDEKRKETVISITVKP